MSMTIGTNASSLVAQRSLHESAKVMDAAMERLSTGKRINDAGDDAAGMAIASRMGGQLVGLETAAKNINDGQALVSAIEGSLSEVSDMLTRMRQIATLAASDTVSTQDRTLLNNELNTLSTELTALSQRTEFNGQKVLDGSYNSKSIQVGANANETIGITQASIAADQIGAFTITGNARIAGGAANNDGAAKILVHQAEDSFTITGTDGTTDSVNYGDGASDTAKSVAAEVNARTGITGVTATAVTNMLIDTSGNAVQFSLASGYDNATYTAVTGATSVADLVANINAVTGTTGITAKDSGTTNKILLTHATGEHIKVQNTHGSNSLVLSSLAADQSTANATTGTVATTKFGMVAGTISLSAAKTFSVTNASTKQSFVEDANTGNSLTVTNNKVNTASVTTQSNANLAIAVFDGAIARVAEMRADLGAVSNRLDHVLDSVISAKDSTAIAISTMVDADMAAESANLARSQVLQQVGTAMLAQANAAPQQVLQLIQ